MLHIFQRPSFFRYSCGFYLPMREIVGPFAMFDTHPNLLSDDHLAIKCPFLYVLELKKEAKTYISHVFYSYTKSHSPWQYCVGFGTWKYLRRMPSYSYQFRPYTLGQKNLLRKIEASWLIFYLFLCYCWLQWKISSQLIFARLTRVWAIREYIVSNSDSHQIHSFYKTSNIPSIPLDSPSPSWWTKPKKGN